MKTARKVLMLVLCAALLVSATVMGTLAYLTDTTDVVENTFTVGNVSFDADSALDEADVNEYGEAIEGADRVVENEYKLIPGHTYTKDPTVHMAEDSEDCYLFVEVVNGISEIEAVGETTIVAQMAEKGWVEVAENIYIYTEDNEKAAVSAGDDVVVFDSFTLADDADVAEYGDETITIKAYAIQKDGMEDMANADLWSTLSEKLA